MSDDDFMALPPFEPSKAMEQLRRHLRDLKLAPRGNGFEWKASLVIELEPGSTEIAARLARRPLRAPEWDRFTIADAAQLRRFVDEARRRLARWGADER
jgi:hypothetical protein